MDNLLKEIKENWAIYAFILAIVLWYGNTNDRLNTLEANKATQQVTIDKINQLSIDMAVVKNDVHNIKQALDVK